MPLPAAHARTVIHELCELYEHSLLAFRDKAVFQLALGGDVLTRGRGGVLLRIGS